MYGSTNRGTEPHMISIGNHVLISFGVTFITRDGVTWVFREQEKYKGTAKLGRICIGNNVFIGAKSIILPNVQSGDNSIVAASAVVTKSVPSGEVWGTSPLYFYNPSLCR